MPPHAHARPDARGCERPALRWLADDPLRPEDVARDGRAADHTRIADVLGMTDGPTRSSLAREVGVFDARGLARVEPFFAEHGFAVIRGLYSTAELHALEVELTRQQTRLVDGELPPECGTAILDDPDALID